LVVLLQAFEPCGDQVRLDGAASDYADLIEEYIRGNYGHAADALRNRHKFDSSLLPPRDRCRQAAAMAHTEAAIRLTGEIEFTLADRQIKRSRQWIHEMKVKPERERFRRDWLLALATFHHGSILSFDPSRGLGRVEQVEGGPRMLLFFQARRFYDEAVDDFENDAEILLSAGAFYEWSGSLSTDKRTLRKAEKLYARARAADPDYTEAQLRYGRALEKRGRYDEARVPLTAVDANVASTYQAYMAKLILGRVEHETGNVAAAIELYRDATELLPEWQVAYLSLSHALHVAGRRDESREVLAGAIRREAKSVEVFQGWWVYERGNADYFEDIWDRMRAELKR